MENRLHIKSQSPTRIEKPFSKTHAPCICDRGACEVLAFKYNVVV